jgi:uncharacterized Ntn-hydrolase superfamily protein
MLKHAGTFSLFIVLLLVNDMNSQTFFSTKLAHTFSIVARDPETGEIGVAVQSHWFNVGAMVPWGEAGVGVVATQSFVNPSFGIRGLALLKKGLSPSEVIDSLVSSDDGRDFRQVAVLDCKGRAASYTGKKCIPAAGNLTGDNFSVQANLMLNENVWPAMAKAFKGSTGPLAERMIAALEAGQKAGGDIRGRQSAALMVFKGQPTGESWEGKLIDLRVEDNPHPITELKRVLKVHRAYEHMNNGDLAVEKGDMEKALAEYSAAEKMFPENEEMKYWHAIALANNNRIEESIPIFKEVFTANENWKTLTSRLIPIGLLKVSNKDLDKILSLK